MSIFSHNVYENVRTRVIVTHEGQLLLLEPGAPEAGWQVPGGGLEHNESLAECGEREVFEETGIHVKVTRVAFLREWVVPKYCVVPDGKDQIGFSIEVFLYANPTMSDPQPLREKPDAPMPHWIPFKQVSALPVWPKELKTLAVVLDSGSTVQGVPSFVSHLESPYAAAPDVIFA